MTSLMFPSTGLQVLSAFVHFLGVTILGHCLSRRLATLDVTTWHGLSQISWPRLCIILVFFDSWLFLFSSGILVFGVGLERGSSICALAIYFCIGFYATSKILIYAFLIERVHVVWSRSVGAKRFRSPVYILCFLTVCLYSAVIALMLVGRIHLFREDGACVIGLKPYSAIPLLSYDVYINVFLTSLFLWPLLRSNIVNGRVKRLAIRTLVASVVALTTSTANLVILAVLRGQELGWICLGSCGADVIVNACALFYATAGAKSRITGTNSSAVVDLTERERDRRPLQINGKQSELEFDIPSTLNSPSANKNNFSNQLHRGRLSDYYPQPPFKGSLTPSSDGHRSDPDPSPEIGKQRSPSRTSLSVLKSVTGLTGLFRKDHSREEYGLQITVTTECERDHPTGPTDCESGNNHNEEEKPIPEDP